MRSKRLFTVGLALAGLFLVAVASASARAESSTIWGVRTGVYTDASEAFLGGEALTPIAAQWYFNPNLEYAFAGDRNVLAVSGDFHYDIIHDRPYYVWAGAGPSVVRRNDEFGDHRTDLGVNLIGGIGWKNPPQIKPYVQAKVTVTDTTEAVLAVGLRF